MEAQQMRAHSRCRPHETVAVYKDKVLNEDKPLHMNALFVKLGSFFFHLNSYVDVKRPEKTFGGRERKKSTRCM